MPDAIGQSVVINAAPAAVWTELIEPARMAPWMGEPAIELRIDTDCTIGAPIVVRGVGESVMGLVSSGSGLLARATSRPI